jgi:osmotically-inducible protein OsmY
MKMRFVCGAALLLSLSAGRVAEVHAQRGSVLGGQQNQQAALGTATASAFGAVGGQGPGVLGQGGLQGQSQRGQGVSGRGRTGQLGQPGAAQQRVGGQDGFVGSDAQQVRNQAMNGRVGRRAMFDFAVESLNEMRAAREQQRSRQNDPAPVRVQLRPLFVVQPRSAQELTTQIASQLRRSLPSSLAATTQITIRGNTATLRGTASNAYDMQLAARMISLQPGIADVENRLLIEPSPTAEPLLLPSR